MIDIIDSRCTFLIRIFNYCVYVLINFSFREGKFSDALAIFFWHDAFVSALD